MNLAQATPNIWPPSILVAVLLLVGLGVLIALIRKSDRQTVAIRAGLSELSNNLQRAASPPDKGTAQVEATLETLAEEQLKARRLLETLLEQVRSRSEGAPPAPEAPHAVAPNWIALPDLPAKGPLSQQAAALAQAASGSIGTDLVSDSIREKIRTASANLATTLSNLEAGSGQRPVQGTFATLIDQLFHNDLGKSAWRVQNAETRGLVAAFDRLRGESARWLEEQGITIIDPIPHVDSFDPVRHEAIAAPDRAELLEHDGKVTEVWRAGIAYQGEVVEKARVRWRRYEAPVPTIQASIDDL